MTVHVVQRDGAGCSCGWSGRGGAKSWRAHAVHMRRRGDETRETSATEQRRDALVDSILNVCYEHAVSMNDSILAGQGATGWRDSELAERLRSLLRAIPGLRGE